MLDAGCWMLDATKSLIFFLVVKGRVGGSRIGRVAGPGWVDGNSKSEIRNSKSCPGEGGREFRIPNSEFKIPHSSFLMPNS
jgi:hypothetical protein